MNSMRNTYWNEAGKHQAFVNALEDRCPGIGYTSNVYVNLFLAMSHLYYDAYNNGGCNIEDCYMRDFRHYVEPYLGDKVRLDPFIYGLSNVMETMMDTAIEFIKDKYLDFPVYPCWVNHEKCALSFVDPGGAGDPMAYGKAGWFEVSFGVKDDLLQCYRGYRDITDDVMKQLGADSRRHGTKAPLEQVIHSCEGVSKKEEQSGMREAAKVDAKTERSVSLGEEER